MKPLPGWRRCCNERIGGDEEESDLNLWLQRLTRFTNDNRPLPKDLINQIDSHFTFAPLRPADEAAFVAALAAVGASRAQGLGLRNGLYRERQAAAEPRLDGAISHAISDGRDSISDGRECAWPCLPEVAAACGAPPLAVLRRMVSREGHLSPRLSAALVEAIVEAHHR